MNTMHRIQSGHYGRTVVTVIILMLVVALTGCTTFPVNDGKGPAPTRWDPADIRFTTMLATVASAKVGKLKKEDVPKIVSILDKVEEGLVMAMPPDFDEVRGFVKRETKGSTRILLFLVVSKAEQYSDRYLRQEARQDITTYREIMRAVIGGGRDGLDTIA